MIFSGNFIGSDLDSVFLSLCRAVSFSSVESPRGLKTKELVFSTIEIENPKNCIVRNKHRKLSREYIEKEIDWYLAGTKSIDLIKDHAKTWSQIADEKGEVNSAYGWQIFTQETPMGRSQFDFVCEKILCDESTRQAVININQLTHKYPTKDFPCTLSLQLIVRNGKLHMLCNMRSSDLIWGLCNDVPFFVYIQTMICETLNKAGLDLELGSYCQATASLHVYERFFKMIDRVIADNSVYKSDLIDSVLSPKALNTMYSGEIARENLVENRSQRNMRSRIMEKIQKIRDKEDPNIYPLF